VRKFRYNIWLIFFGFVALLFCTNLYAQKPKVGIVVWDGHAKEGQNVGTFRLYQIGEVTPGLCQCNERIRSCRIIDKKPFGFRLGELSQDTVKHRFISLTTRL